MSDSENCSSFIKFQLSFARSQKKLHRLYFTEEILFNFQVIINEGCKQYRYLL
jgi:hypothetical protein